MEREFFQAIQNGQVYSLAGSQNIETLPWNNHASFTGVALKHLVTGKDTNGQFSSHLVRIMAGCEIGRHLHAGKWELHEVVQGTGRLSIGQQELVYQSGVEAVIPADLIHAVKAGDADLYILAKFVPALL